MRLFVAVDIPDEILDRVCEAAKELADPNVKVIPRENLHITLAFLGKMELDDAEKVMASLKLEPGDVTLKGAGVFPNQEFVKIAWVGVEGRGMKRNADKLIKAFKIEEGREARLHLTVARVYGKTEKAKTFVEKYGANDFGTFRPDAICLYESVLKKPNPEYKLIREYGL
jgi:2'-5' RNA ligase